MAKLPQVVMEIAEIFNPLRKISKRYKIYYGGRAGGKSWGFADSALILGRQRKLRIACVREIQESIKDSVHKLLSDRIRLFGLNDYRIMEDSIINQVTGTEIIFKGLKDQNAKNIKSLEGIDICWVEEGQTMTRKSWEILDPTIRKDGSEIWISMNRDEETDPLWKILAANPDNDTLVVRVNWYDNPFCPEEIKRQALKCKAIDYETYLHIWEGNPKSQGDKKLISSVAVLRAQKQKIDGSSSPLIIGLDIARFGDDSSIFCFRKGRWCYKISEHKKLDNVEVANVATSFIKTYKPHRVFIDIGGQGAGVYDILKDRGFKEIIRSVGFGDKAILSDRYVNRRAEMWDGIREWLNDDLPVQIPNDDELYNDLVVIEKSYDNKGRLQLEKKEEIKARIGRSPDKGDALALTFAEPVYDIGRPKLYGNGEVTAESLFRDIGLGNGGW